MHGLLLVNKPKGKTSFYLVACLRRILKEKTIGHAGTLDPFATGVMVMMIGKPFTKLSDSFLSADKEYVARAYLGSSSDTFDCDGIITATSTYVPTLGQVEEVIAQFQGTIMQKPPMFSAKKVGGKKLYELARKGVSIDVEAVSVNVKTELLSYNYPYLDFKISCSKGTYIRSIANEMGKALGSEAHLIELTRIRSGAFSIESCLDWDRFIAVECGSSLLTPSISGIINIPDDLRCKSLLRLPTYQN